MPGLGFQDLAPGQLLGEIRAVTAHLLPPPV